MASKSKPALGKGLSALIPVEGSNNIDALEPSSMMLPGSVGDDGSRVFQANIDEIVPSPFQPRHQFTQEQLDELVVSIKEHGIIQPLIVRQVNKTLELIAGERRWRAAKVLGLSEVPTIIRKASDKEVLEWALVENLQREDLNAIEEAIGYARLANEFNLKQEQIATRVGKNRTSVTNAIRLLELNGEVQDFLVNGLITVGHAKAILSVKNKEQQLILAKEVIKKGWTVRQTEKNAKIALTPHPTEKSSNLEKPKPILSMEKQLTKIFSTKVFITRQTGAHKGKLEIAFDDTSELQRVLELLGMDADDIRKIK